ncbi:glycoside hydrolase family 15 protein [Ferroplasma acidiphilum]|uniref:glycoside hydrolase family 15 protein n=1 Tax=Ferroplasma acidiphilum TaxID=74969 RepID=UPI002814B91C|nr:glycoside hydrolase family 15 protein [Ferroplasma acidiphilum]WMT53320.1 MAG: glycoside hydrolase family 15 protein [Ferroplasma acidiphilum]
MGTYRGLYDLHDAYRSDYLKIANHGFIANNRTAALVGIDGTIDWACLPNFNSNPVFDSILDARNGGYFKTSPVMESNANQYYEESTNILITEFVNNNQVILRLTDFLPTSSYSTITFPEIHRLIEAPYSDVEVSIDIKSHFNFGSGKTNITRDRNGYIFSCTDDTLGISTNLKLKKGNGNVYSRIKLEKGSHEWIVVLSGVRQIGNVRQYESYTRLEETRNYWSAWAGKINYSGLYYDHVIRSALTLRGLFYDPTGMMVAAPTTSLPEIIGGERNWDYRYTWIRDTAYVVEALSLIGLKDVATKFLYDIMSIVQKDKKVKTIYPVNGDSKLEEKKVNLSGYMDSIPVRIGNEASEQLQIDQYGSIVNAVFRFHEAGGLVTTYLWDFLIEILDTLKDIWKLPDSSIWEFRSEPKHYLYSKLISWSAFNRAIKMGRELGYSAPYRTWHKIREEIKNEIMEKGYNPDVKAFTQYYGSDQMDASVLRMPLTGIISAKDPRFVSTLARVEAELKNPCGMFIRYHSDDGLKGHDNAFLLLSFWYVEDLILSGRIMEAKETFENILDHSNHLMLFSEEINFNDCREMLGNFPQAITHLGVIRAAIKLDEALRGK